MFRNSVTHFYILLIVSALNLSAYGQVIPGLRYLSHIVIQPEEINGEILGGFSGITFNSETQEFVLVADKYPSRIVTGTVDFNEEPKIRWNKTLYLGPKPLESSELEGIAFDRTIGNYFLSDEQKEGTRILETDKLAKFKRIVLPNNRPFLPLSSHNSGIEGLTISDDGNYLYYAFERPTQTCADLRVTTIGKINMYTSQVEVFPYQLHEVANDILGTNGISALLSWNDSTLLVMERAYIPNTGNIVRLYEVIINGNGIDSDMITCKTEPQEYLQSRLVYDFGDEPSINIDNAEGMSFNEDRSQLYIITDNNFSKKQESQLVVLDIKQ